MKNVFLGTDSGATTSKTCGVWEDGTPVTLNLAQSSTNSQLGKNAVITGWVEGVEKFLPTTLESWRGVAVAQRLSETAGLAAFVETDTAAAALGESLHGAGRNVGAFYYLYFGVGLGGSMVKDGVPLRGFYGNAGEIGHVPMVPNGRACSCGNKGCLERYVSLEAFQRRAPIIGEAGWSRRRPRCCATPS